jgi:peptidoglycan hydrolase-like protein with peptidoglycan-binding domain
LSKISVAAPSLANSFVLREPRAAIYSPVRPMALRTLRTGMRGPDVKAVQQGLNTRDGGVQPKLVEDGVFGPNTDEAVSRIRSKTRIEIRRMTLRTPASPMTPQC